MTATSPLRYRTREGRFWVRISVSAWTFVDGEAVATPATFAVHSPVSSRYPSTMAAAIRIARWAAGDYDCAACGTGIHWVPEPRRVYVHNTTGETLCADGAAVADIARHSDGSAVGPWDIR